MTCRPPQRAALSAAFGLAETPGPPDPLQLYLACLTLLSQQAGDAPLLLVVDDAQWIDQATLDVLAFVARRLADDPIALAFGSREAVAADLGPGQPDAGPGPADRRGSPNQLLDLQPAPPAGHDGRCILEQAAGNPLALVELTRAAAADPAAAAGWHGQAPAADRAAAPVVHRLGAGAARADSARAAASRGRRQPRAEPELSERSLGVPAAPGNRPGPPGSSSSPTASVTFPHPLIRSAIYQAAPPPTARRAPRAGGRAGPPARPAGLAAGRGRHRARRGAGAAAAVLAASPRARPGRDRAAAWQRAAELSPDPRDAGRAAAQAAGALGGPARSTGYLPASRALELTDEPAVRGQARRPWAGPSA